MGSPKTWHKLPTISHNFATQITDGKTIRDKTTSISWYFHVTESRDKTKQVEEPSFRPLALALAQPLTLQAASAVGMNECGWFAANYPAVLASTWPLSMPFHVTFFLFWARRRTVEVRGNPYVLGEKGRMYDEHERQLTTLANTQHQV